MKALLFKLAVKMLFTILTPGLAQKLYDKMIAAVDKYVSTTPYTIDDIIWNAIKHGGEVIDEMCNEALDFIENYVLGTHSKVDDALVLPIIEMLRNIKILPDMD